MKNAFAEIEKDFQGKKLAAAVYNVGGRFVRKPFLELTLEEYTAGYEANGYVPSSYCQFNTITRSIARGIGELQRE